MSDPYSIIMTNCDQKVCSEFPDFVVSSVKIVANLDYIVSC